MRLRLARGAPAARSSVVAGARAVIVASREARTWLAANQRHIVGVVVPYLAMIAVAALVGWFVAAAVNS